MKNINQGHENSVDLEALSIKKLHFSIHNLNFFYVRNLKQVLDELNKTQCLNISYNKNILQAWDSVFSYFNHIT